MGPRDAGSALLEKVRVCSGCLSGNRCARHPLGVNLLGTVSLNEPRAKSWRGALVTKAVGGYGYSGWVWETVEGRFQIKQGPKLIHLETSIPA